MPTIKFIPSNQDVEVEKDTKILVAARKGKVPLRFGCASCRCGTCAVRLNDGSKFAPMEEDEKALLKKMKLPTKGLIRLSCRARIQEEGAIVDVSFQDEYDPDP